MFATVARYRDAGLSTFPIRKGTKSPAVRSWREFQERLPCWHQLAAWFAGPRACRSLAIVCGRVSDNLTVIDFDAPELYQPWYDLCRMCGVDLSAIAAIVATPSGGRHVYIHGPAPDGNQKLACAADGSTLIETRGTGGYVLAPPSPGYTVLGGDVASRNQADAETLDAMLDCARAFDAKPVVETCAAGVIPAASRGQVEGGPRTPSPGDLYNRRDDYHSVLLQHGWRRVGRRGGRDYWRRPGKSHGISASTTRHDDGKAHLVVWSSNAAPLLPYPVTYLPFGVLAALEFGGDYSAAARSLAQRGRT